MFAVRGIAVSFSIFILLYGGLSLAHKASSTRCSSGPSCREELRNGWKIRLIR